MMKQGTKRSRGQDCSVHPSQPKRTRSLRQRGAWQTASKQEAVREAMAAAGLEDDDDDDAHRHGSELS
jgi:3-oxoacyl-(acyl-carrier-protein) synthase